MTNRNLDITIARLLGLIITIRHISATGISPVRVEDEPFEEMGRPSRERTYANGKPLRPYHQSSRYAVAALEQICDERKLNSGLRRAFVTEKWCVELYSKRTGKRMAIEVDKSFPLAICKALARLRSKE